jgi:hypothetical protein
MKKGLILCLGILVAFAVVASASVKFSKRGEEISLFPAKSGAKDIGTADSIANVTGGSNDAIWRCMSGPGGRNLGEDAATHSLVSLYARATSGSNFGILMYGYSFDGGTTWAASELFPADTLRRFYSAVTVDAQGWPHFACQAAKAPYSGFGLWYLRDEAGIGGGLLTTPVLLNDTTQATGTTPYNPNIVVNGSAGENIFVSASDYSGVYATNSNDGHMGYRSNDGAATWDPMEYWFNPTWTDPNYGNIDGPAMCISDDGQHLFSIVNAGQCVVGTDTLAEMPFTYYSNDGGDTWMFGGALNTADTTVPRNGLSYVAGGWWHIGATAMDHNGIVHVVWFSNGSEAPNQAAGATDTIYHDPLIHSYNTTAYDYTSWTHEKIGNAPVLDYTNNIYTGNNLFATVSITPTNDVMFMFCDTYDTLGYVGVWGQLKESDGTLNTPKLLNTMDGINVGSWIESQAVLVDDTMHVTWGKGGDTWSNVTALMHSMATVDGLKGVAGNPPTVTSHSFVLNQSRPNPVRDNATISFSLPKTGNYSLKVYNIAGQVVRTLDGKGNAGLNKVSWNGMDNNGRKVANGIYLYNLKAFGNSATKKLVVVR